VTDPILELNLAEAGIASIVWATGFAVDYSWLKVDAFDEKVGRSISAVFRMSLGSTFWDCHGCRGGNPPSSGASGTTPSIWRTIFPRNASIWRIILPREGKTEGS
jgi:putative flavoprotein involved in K+ transport